MSFTRRPMAATLTRVFRTDPCGQLGRNRHDRTSSSILSPIMDGQGAATQIETSRRSSLCGVSTGCDPNIFAAIGWPSRHSQHEAADWKNAIERLANRLTVLQSLWPCCWIEPTVDHYSEARFGRRLPAKSAEELVRSSPIRSEWNAPRTVGDFQSIHCGSRWSNEVLSPKPFDHRPAIAPDSNDVRCLAHQELGSAS